MSNKINWGIMSTAYIAIDHVIPAIKNSKYSQVHAIASRSVDKAESAAIQYSIPKYYGDYQSLLDDNDVDAVYIPLPNHLHVEWSIKALEAGKHVLVEKSIGLNSDEALKLIEESKKYPKLKIMEAFMYRHHPQWIKTKEIINNGIIGEVKTIQSSFTFYEDSSDAIVNTKSYGGGSLLDIGCYPISLSRFIFDSEPEKVIGTIKYHEKYGVDSVATAIMKFKNCTSSFYSSIQAEEGQRVEICGSIGRIELEVPFNPIANKEAKILLYKNSKIEEIVIEPCDQYTIQADLFSLAILNNSEVPTPLTDAYKNIKVIERIVESDRIGNWA